MRRTYDLGRMHGFALVRGEKVEYKPLDTLEDDYHRGLKDGVTEAKEWRKGMGGIAEELGEIVRKVWGALTRMPDIPDVLRLATSPTLSAGVKQTRPSSKGDLKHYSKEELARRLNTTTEDVHRNIKKVIKKKFHGELKKIGSPDNPEILVDRSGNLWLQNPQTRRAINTGRPLDMFKK